MSLLATWIDSGQEPKHPSNPAYPAGKAVDLTQDPDAPACETVLPYPAPRIGVFIVECSLCRLRVGVTTAGRPDDPRSIKLNCKPRKDLH